jgi:hypothetical protein
MSTTTSDEVEFDGLIVGEPMDIHVLFGKHSKERRSPSVDSIITDNGPTGPEGKLVLLPKPDLSDQGR